MLRIYEKKFKVSEGLASEVEIMRFFSVLGSLKLAKNLTLLYAFEMFIDNLTTISNELET